MWAGLCVHQGEVGGIVHGVAGVAGNEKGLVGEKSVTHMHSDTDRLHAELKITAALTIPLSVFNPTNGK